MDSLEAHPQALAPAQAALLLLNQRPAHRVPLLRRRCPPTLVASSHPVLLLLQSPYLLPSQAFPQLNLPLLLRNPRRALYPHLYRHHPRTSQTTTLHPSTVTARRALTMVLLSASEAICSVSATVDAPWLRLLLRAWLAQTVLSSLRPSAMSTSLAHISTAALLPLACYKSNAP